MKNIIAKILIIGTISISIFSSSCKKEESEGNNFNFYDSTVYIEGCNIVNKGIARTSPYKTYNYTVTFYSPNVTYDEAKDTYSGKGSWITINMISSSETGVLHGQYTYDRLNSKDSLTINSAELSLYDKIDDYSYSYNLTMGVVELMKSGNSYDFKIDLLYVSPGFPDKLADPLVGFYNGTVKEFTKKP